VLVKEVEPGVTGESRGRKLVPFRERSTWRETPGATVPVQERRASYEFAEEPERVTGQMTAGVAQAWAE
jgi:hypothetical protein